MKAQDKEHIWQQLDGEPTDPERAQPPRRATEPDTEWTTRQVLHHSLQKMEAEQPSMRFVMNVMDRLPQLYKKMTVQPLVHPRWVRAFLYMLTGAGLLYVGVVVHYVQTAEDAAAALSPTIDWLLPFFALLPAQSWGMMATLCASYLFFVLLDRHLRKRFSKTDASPSKENSI